MLKSTKLTIFRNPKIAKTAISELLVSPKLISRKIRKTEKSLISHTVLDKIQIYVKNTHYVDYVKN